MHFPVFQKDLAKTQLGRDTSAFFLSLFSFLLSAAFSCVVSLWVLPNFDGYSLMPAEVLSHPHSPSGYIAGVSSLSAPLFLEVLLLWVSAYTSVEKLLLIILFGFRGLSVGAALASLVALTPPPRYAVAALCAYVCVSALYLLFTRAIRKESGIPVTESILQAMMTVGVAALTLVAIYLYSVSAT